MSAQSPLLGLAQRIPPTNLPAEQALLGALMGENKALRHVDGLEPEHFADPVHGRIFAAIRHWVAMESPADPTTLRSEVERSDELADAIGADYLAQLLAAPVGIIDYGQYAASIRDAWARRELIAIGEDMVEAAFAQSDLSAEEQVAIVRRRLQELLVSMRQEAGA